MTEENHVYFRLQGNEATPVVLVRVFTRGETEQAETSWFGSQAGRVPFEYPTSGEPHTVLRDARDFAAGHGYDVRIQLDGIEWNSDYGTLVG